MDFAQKIYHLILKSVFWGFWSKNLAQIEPSIIVHKFGEKHWASYGQI